MIRKMTTVAAACAATFGLTCVGAPSAQATNYVCDYTEVCLYDGDNYTAGRHTTGTNYAYYSDKYWYSSTGTRLSGDLNDDVSSAKNRGAPCYNCDQVAIWQHHSYRGERTALISRGFSEPNIVYGDDNHLLGSSSHSWGNWVG